MPGPRQRRTASVDGDARELILDAAEELIAESGFDATSTAAIAKQAGVPKGLVFYYFPTKSAILTTLIAERLPAEPLADVAGLVVTGEPESTLVNLEAALNLRDHHSSVMRVIIWREAETHPAVRAHLRRFRTYLHDATVEVLRASSPVAVSARVLDSCATTWVAAMFSVASIDRLRDLDGTREHREDLGGVARVVAAGLEQLGAAGA
ncbi:TetR/AcrR family transcriptional regulator [Rhodococcus maanshanensis]|jgi:AcrR family transcriptional regulator|uniref:DNA-binding transcriptional regulator, AcrR family n=1 Tax=Rhodococcus maanshanensis TaxID=183556 RepID=A0A1H7JYN6_9NOCA|nr:TetR/AcrR family transcriptional regulator [Rhodococcus maanshanensis]SEK78725.1 DNA-binding transcriptional regulator, AcrR family [Rhodococcus maanshanensis]